MVVHKEMWLSRKPYCAAFTSLPFCILTINCSLVIFCVSQSRTLKQWHKLFCKVLYKQCISTYTFNLNVRNVPGKLWKQFWIALSPRESGPIEVELQFRMWTDKHFLTWQSFPLWVESRLHRLHPVSTIQSELVLKL